MDKIGFVIRTYKPGDEIAINEMFNEVFHQNRSLEHWYWKYRNNPYGSHKIALALAPDGTLAAHYGGYPVKLVFCFDKRKQEFMAYQLGDKMTRKAFRGVGFGRNALLALTFREFQKNFGTDSFFGYGFGTHHSLRFGLLFLDYVDVEPVPFRKVSVKELWQKVETSALRRVLAMRKVREVDAPDKQWDDFFSKVAPSYRFLTKRDAEYLKWRYVDRPDRRYLILSVMKKGRLSGWSVFYREGSKLIWGDGLFELDDIESVRVMFSHLLKSHYSRGVETVECWFSVRPSWWDRILNALGFDREAEPSNLHLTGPITDPEALSMLKGDFFYTVGDSDLF